MNMENKRSFIESPIGGSTCSHKVRKQNLEEHVLFWPDLPPPPPPPPPAGCMCLSKYWLRCICWQIRQTVELLKNFMFTSRPARLLAHITAKGADMCLQEPRSCGSFNYKHCQAASNWKVVLLKIYILDVNINGMTYLFTNSHWRSSHSAIQLHLYENILLFFW